MPASVTIPRLRKREEKQRVESKSDLEWRMENGKNVSIRKENFLSAKR
jgi:hypothetical protein